MTTGKDGPSPNPTESQEREKEAELEDTDVSPWRNLDDYVKVMVSLRGGSRPILCW